MSRTEQKTQTRQRILDAAGRGFRKGGFGGVGVDGLAKEAGVTSGAFYAHFPSKEAAFEQATLAGIDELRQAVESMREARGGKWIDAFIDFYLSEKRVCDLGESCAVQSLVPEAGRAAEHIRTAVGERLASVAKAIADGLPEGRAPERLDRAWALLAILSGGVSLARAAGGQPRSDAIARAVGRAAREAVASGKQPAPR